MRTHIYLPTPPPLDLPLPLYSHYESSPALVQVHNELSIMFKARYVIDIIITHTSEVSHVKTPGLAAADFSGGSGCRGDTGSCCLADAWEFPQLRGPYIYTSPNCQCIPHNCNKRDWDPHLQVLYFRYVRPIRLSSICKYQFD